MNIYIDLNNFNFKRSAKNFMQIFIIGWLVIISLLFTWSATSGYGLEKTLDDFSFELILNPIFWFVPFLLALTVSFIRGIKHKEFDIESPKQLEAYYEQQKLSNQPLWFKFLLVSFAVSIIFTALKPESEITLEQYKLIEREIAIANSRELTSLYNQIISDDVIMGSEYRDFRNLSLKVQFGQQKAK